MGRIANSIEIAKASLRVLQADKELLVLPVISAVASIVTAATFIVPLFASGALDPDGPAPASYVVLFLMYVALAYVTMFFNTALVDATHDRLRGGNPTVASAIAGAKLRAGRILPWAIVSATVSMALRALEERMGFIGQILAGLAGVAWTVVTFMVLPIIVIEGLGVVDAINKSSQLFKQTWGENLAARAGFGLLGFVAAIPAFVLVFVGAGFGTAGLTVTMALAIPWLITVAVVLAALNVIFQTALYHFATTGEVPGGFFPASTLQGAFGPKRR